MENQVIEVPEQVTSDQGSDTGPQPISRSLKAVAERVLAAPSQPFDSGHERKRRHEIMSRLLSQAGDAFIGYKLNRWRADGDKQRKVLDAVNEWWRSFPDRKGASEGLVLYGPVGTGKDHL